MPVKLEKYQCRIYRPLIPLTVALVAGIATGIWLPGHFGPVLVLSLGFFAFLWMRRVRRQWAGLIPLILCVCIGYLSIQPWLAPNLPPHHIARYVDQGRWQIHGVVSQSPIIRQGRWQFELSAMRILNKQNTHAVCGKIHVTGRGRWPGAQIGDEVVFRGRLRAIRSFSNPSGFDYERFMMLKGIRARVYASANSLKITSKTTAANLQGEIQQIRDVLARDMDAALHNRSDQAVGLLKAIILGDRSGITPVLRTAFNRVGVGHVLAISGLHVGMVATVAFFTARWLFSLIPFFQRRAWSRKAAALVSLIPVVIYGLLAGLSPSTQRAMLMVGLFLVGFWVGRRHDWLNTIAIAAMVILVVYPPAVLSISFQLSFAAVLAICAGSRLIPEVDKTNKAGWLRKTRHRLIAALGVSLLAIIGTLPLVLRYFNQISLIGPAANLAVVPLVGLVVVPAGLLGTLTAIINSEVGAFFWQIAGWGAEVVVWGVQRAGAWQWAAIRSVTPSGLEICLFYIGVALCLYWKKVPHRAAALAVTLVLIGLDAGYWFHQRHGRSQMRVTAIDVGQASANLLELPGGYTILIDGGGFSDNTLFDVGAKILAPLLWSKKIRTVDLVVLSHPNSDHLNGLLFILEHFNVKAVWSNHEAVETQAYERWVALLTEHGVRHADFKHMPRQTVRNGIQLEILAPPRDFQVLKQAAAWRDENNNSLVMRAQHGEISFLFCGDIETPAEADLLKRVGQGNLGSTILMVPHHGSRSSSSEAFLNAVKPEEAIISAGWKNRYHLPHKEVTDRLNRVRARIWSTAQNGALEIVTDGHTYGIRTFRSNTPLN